MYYEGLVCVIIEVGSPTVLSFANWKARNTSSAVPVQTRRLENQNWWCKSQSEFEGLRMKNVSSRCRRWTSQLKQRAHASLLAILFVLFRPSTNRMMRTGIGEGDLYPPSPPIQILISSVNASQDRHTQNQRFTDHLRSLSPVRGTHKINHHSSGLSLDGMVLFTLSIIFSDFSIQKNQHLKTLKQNSEEIAQTPGQSRYLEIVVAEKKKK